MPCPRVTVEGRVVEDPSLRFAQSGIAICDMRVVASDRRKVDDQWVDGDQLWIDVTVFKQMAEHCAESLTKGDIVLVQGRLHTESWENREGEKRSKIAIVADVVAPSLQFRSLPHGTGRAERSSAPASDPWQAGGGESDEPP